MADFRKWLYAFAVVALLAGFTIPASAQVLITCSATSNNPLIRAEEYTAMSGDIFIQCTGGIPTAIGSLVPKVTITVFTNTAITSKLTDTTQNPAFNEALLIVDEAGSVGSTNPTLNCGNALAPYGTTPFTCDTVSTTGTGTLTYNGTAGHPNVFQGRQVNNSGGQAIQFIGVPIDAPGPANGFVLPSRTFRITNLRVNAVSFNINVSQGFSLQTINSTVSFNGTNFGGNQTLNVPNGTVRVGLVTTAATPVADDLLAGSATFLQCNATAGATSNSILLTEGFPTAFKVRNWAQIQANGNPPIVSGGDWTWNGGTTWSATDLNQNVPNALYNTESGIMYNSGLSNPSPNPPTGVSSGTWPLGSAALSNINGIAQAGTASQGTRFAIQLSSIPGGSNPSVPLVVHLETGSIPTDSDTGVMVLVCGNDANGAGGIPGSCAASGAIAGTSLVPASGLVVYEVIFSNPNALEFADVPVYVNPTVNLNATPPVGGTPEVGPTATATASFAPFYGGAAVGYAGVGAAQPMTPTLTALGAPIPRFRQDFQPTPTISLFGFGKCACDLLFPWVVGDATFTTSIVVANTSLDPCAGTPCSAGFTASPQSGRVTFWFFGTSDVGYNPSNFGAGITSAGTVIKSQTTTALVPPGSYVAFIVSPSAAIAGGQTTANGLGPIFDTATGKVGTNFAGYVIAQSEFQYCHGVASISAPNLNPQTYLGLILDKAGRGLPGVQKTRTLQNFADELNN